jgi:hypothetical protein
MRSAPRVL